MKCCPWATGRLVEFDDLAGHTNRNARQGARMRARMTMKQWSEESFFLNPIP